jgi:hypothetical protein
MHEYTERLDATAFSMEQDLQRNSKLDSSNPPRWRFVSHIRFYRNSENAEDVAQEASQSRIPSFRRLRDSDRFRAWLVRITWRLAINDCAPDPPSGR